MKELHGKAAEAAQSWKNKTAAEAVAVRRAALAAASRHQCGAVGHEQGR
jgi:hypothetical protein